MFRRHLLTALAGSALVLAMGIQASAQFAELRGHVVMKQADGTKVPAADAIIDVYRTDVQAKYATKTDKKGVFVFAGLPFSGTYLVVASREGAAPNWLPGVKAGQNKDYEIELTPGDGRRLTPEQLKAIMTEKRPASPGGESAEDKAKREELAKKNAEILESNRKVEEGNAVIQRTFKAGNELLLAKKYDEAIAQYNEGLSVDPNHPGVPSLLTNKSSALNARGVSKFNAAIQSKDDAAKAAGLEAAKKDWREARESSAKAVELLKASSGETDPAQAANIKTNLYYALAMRAETSRLFVTKVDQTQVDSGITAYQEYIANEIDPVKKSKAEHDLAQMLFDANAFDKALVQYQKILQANPDDLDALLRSGQALFNLGAMDNDKAKYQEAANFLAKFVEKAPDGNALKEDAKAILESLKTQENVKPVAPARRRRP